MSRRPPADLNIVARFYDRWSPHEDKRREIAEDHKEMFAEAKAEGLNAKVLRKAFAEQYRVENQTSDQAEKRNANEEDVELYLSALARVREDDDHDADGVIIETSVHKMHESPPDAVLRPQTGVDLALGVASAEQVSVESSVTVSKQEPSVEADRDGGAGELGGEEGSQSPLPSAPAENSADGPRVQGAAAPHSEPAPAILPSPDGAGAVAARGDSVGPSTVAAASRPTPLDRPFATHNPDTHFLNSKGMPRLHGCLGPEACGGSWRKLCFTCSVKHDGPAAHVEEVAVQ